MRRFMMHAFVIAAVLLVAVPAYAATVDPTNNPLNALQVLVSDLYSASLSLVGLCVFVMFLIAGLSYILPKQMQPAWMGDPWGIIQDAIIGMVLLFSAFLILNSINPDLVGSGTTAPAGQSSGTNTNPLPQAADAKPITASEKTTSRNGVTFRDSGSSCSAATEPCIPGYSCSSGTCKMALNGTLQQDAFCLSDAQCGSGLVCGWVSYVGGNKKCTRIGGSDANNSNLEGI